MARRLVLAGLLLVALVSQAAGSAASRHGAVTCADTATEIRGAVPNRDGLLLVNNGSATVFHGQHDSSGTQALTAANGTPLAAGASFAFERGEMTGAYSCITSSGTVDLRWKETYK